jgi:hypothetical protein
MLAPFYRRSALGPVTIAFDLAFPSLGRLFNGSLFFKPSFPLTGFDHLPFALIAAEVLLLHAYSPLVD